MMTTEPAKRVSSWSQLVAIISVGCSVLNCCSHACSQPASYAATPYPSTPPAGATYDAISSPVYAPATNSGSWSAQVFSAAPAFDAPRPSGVVAESGAVGQGVETTEAIEEPDADLGVRQCGFDCCETIPFNHSDHYSGDLLGRSSSRDSPYFFGGWLAQGVTFNPDSPDDRSNAPVVFNDRSNDYQLNQLYLSAGKRATSGPANWGFGWRADLLYGTDSRFLTVPGIEENSDRTNRLNEDGDLYGLALPQLYLDLATPLGPNGSILRVGRFNAHSGFENFTAPSNFFYSRSYAYAFGAPFTLSGVQWLGQLDAATSASIALTRGWDSFDANNDEWGLHGGVTRQYNGGRTLLTLNARVGEDFTGVTTAAGAQSDTRLLVNGVLKHNISQDWYYAIQADYGRQASAVVELDTVNNTIGFSDAQWYGVSQYLVRRLNRYWSAGGRVEWFRDEGNSRIGIPINFANGGPSFLGDEYFAITGGLNYQPHRNALLRTELRWDFSDVESNPAVPGGVAGIRTFNDNTEDNQLTLAVDLVLTF